MAVTAPERHALSLRIASKPAVDRHGLDLRINPGRRSGKTAQAQSISATGAQRYQRAVTNQTQSTAGNGQHRAPVKRYLTRSAAAGYRIGTAVNVARRLEWDRSTIASHHTALAFALAAPTGRRFHLRFARSDTVDIGRDLSWAEAEPTSRKQLFPWRATAATDTSAMLRWLSAEPTSAAACNLVWRTSIPRDRRLLLAWDSSQPMVEAALAPWQPGNSGAAASGLPWRVALAVPYGGLHRIVVVPPTVPPQPHCYQSPSRRGIHFRMLRTARDEPVQRHALQFALHCRRGRFFDLRSSLGMSHTLSVVRLPGRQPLSVTRISLSTDRDSWGWSMQLSFADAASLIAVEPTTAGAVSIEIALDGHVWVGEVDGYTEERRFNVRNGSVTARSRTAQLGAPRAPERSYTNGSATTAQQLAAGEMRFTGFDLDWRIPDWPLPAGVYSADRSTPLAAVITVANAAGAMVQSALASDTLIVAPRYPTAPWTLGTATPDFALGGGTWLATGKRWVAGPAYNGVYVSGRDQGVLARVYRDGTSGSPYAPMVVDPLITDVAPARGRGIEVIATSLPRHEIPIELPLRVSSAPPGLLLPGELGELLDTVWGTYRAVVDSVEISAEVSKEGLVTARQRATLWRTLA